MSFVRQVPLNRAMMKYDAKAALQGRVLISFVACLLPMLLPLLSQLFKIDFGGVHVLVMLDQVYDITFLVPSLILSALVTLLAQNPMGVCLSRFFLRVNRDRQNKPSPLSVCDCFGPVFWRLVGATFLRDALVFLSALVPVLIGLLMPGARRVSLVDGDLAIRGDTFFQVFILIAMAVGVIQTLRYSMLPYVLAEQPGLSVRQALRESVSITRGRIWELFVLQLSFVGWMFLVTFSFFLAAIYVYPYLETTQAAYYIAFTKAPDSNDDKAIADHAA